VPKKRAFREGDWFSVPLRHEKHALGLVARVDRRGDSFLGYYFVPGVSRENDVKLTETVSARDAILIAASGAYGLTHNLWSIFASSPQWSRRDWPIPVFQRTDMAGRTFLETYGDDNVLLPIPAKIQPLDPRIPAAAVESGLLDAGAVEDVLWYKLRDRLMIHGS
jgi:hypothetical protein